MCVCFCVHCLSRTHATHGLESDNPDNYRLLVAGFITYSEKMYNYSTTDLPAIKH